MLQECRGIHYFLNALQSLGLHNVHDGCFGHRIDLIPQLHQVNAVIIGHIHRIREITRTSVHAKSSFIHLYFLYDRDFFTISLVPMSDYKGFVSCMYIP